MVLAVRKNLRAPSRRNAGHSRAQDAALLVAKRQQPLHTAQVGSVLRSWQGAVFEVGSYVKERHPSKSDGIKQRRLDTSGPPLRKR